MQTPEDIFEELDIEIAPTDHHHTTTGWVQLDCPFCSPNSHRWRLGFHRQGCYFSCWHCGGLSIWSVIEALTHADRKTLRQLTETLGKASVRPADRRSGSKGRLRIPPGVKQLRTAHRRYLEKRGFNPDVIARLWKVQGIGIAGRLSWRLFIPIIWQGRTVSWTTRTIGNKAKVRYLSAKTEEERLPHKSLLYGYDYVRHNIMIVEGPIDVWAIGPGCVATMGTAYTQAQFNLLVRVKNRYICFDNEPDAQQRAKKLCRELSAFPGDTQNISLDAKDAASEKPSNIRRLRSLLETI